MSTTPVNASTPATAMTTPNRAVSKGIPAASSEPKVIASTRTATSTPIKSSAPGFTGLLSNAAPPTSTFVTPACGAFFDRRLERVEGGGLEVGSGDLVVDLRDGRGALRGDGAGLLRGDDRGHLGRLRGRGENRGHGPFRGRISHLLPGRHGEHELRVRARGGRELLLHLVERLLRLRAGHGEGLVDLPGAAERGHARDRRGGRGDPEREHQAASAESGSGYPV